MTWPERCAFPGCGRKSKDLGLCMTHWWQYENDPKGVLQPHRLDLRKSTGVVESPESKPRRKRIRPPVQKRSYTSRLPQGNRKDLECTFDGCDRKQSAKGFCTGHYVQQHEGRPLKPLKKYPPRISRKGDCLFTGCGRIVQARGYCQPHYMQLMAGKELTELEDMAPYIPVCRYPGCTEAGRSTYCSGHQAHQRRYGRMFPLHRPGQKEQS